MNKLLLSLSLLTLSACASTVPTPAEHSSPHALTPQDLAHRHFILIQVDHTTVAQGNTMYPGVDFNEHQQFAATFCNDLQGTYRIKDQYISSELRPVSQRQCTNPALAKWDSLFTDMLQQGANITLENHSLTLSTPSHTMYFQLKDWVY